MLDPEMHLASGNVEITEEHLQALEYMVWSASVALDHTQGSERFFEVRPVSFEEAAIPLPMVQIFECDLGTMSASAFVMNPTAALKLAEAIRKAAMAACAGAYRQTVQGELNRETF